jgi:hypothetical protein
MVQFLARDLNQAKMDPSHCFPAAAEPVPLAAVLV